MLGSGECRARYGTDSVMTDFDGMRDASGTTIRLLAEGFCTPTGVASTLHGLVTTAPR